MKKNIIKSIKKVHEKNIDEPIEKRLIEALNDWKNIKEQYRNTGINPCFIIQISNQIKGEKEKEKVIQILNKQGILWYYDDAKGFSSSDRINELKGERSKDIARKYVINPTSNIEVLIFKLSFTEGFDIPRACYLFQIRKVVVIH